MSVIHIGTPWVVTVLCVHGKPHGHQQLHQQGSICHSGRDDSMLMGETLKVSAVIPSPQQRRNKQSRRVAIEESPLKV